MTGLTEGKGSAADRTEVSEATTIGPPPNTAPQEAAGGYDSRLDPAAYADQDEAARYAAMAIRVTELAASELFAEITDPVDRRALMVAMILGEEIKTEE